MEINKRYFWLKLKKDFFQSKEIKIIRKMPSGGDILIVLFKMQLLSLDTNGLIEIDNITSCIEEELSIMIDEDLDLIKLSLITFNKFSLIGYLENKDILMIMHEDITGSDTASTLRSRKSRLKNKKTLHCNTKATPLQQNATQSKSKSNIKDLELELENRVTLKDKDKKLLSSKHDDIHEIINYLNLICKTNYKTTTSKTIQLINSRIKEGFTAEDFYLVIDKKYKEWFNTDHEKYLRPETLFGSKFESYLNQRIVKTETKEEKNRREGAEWAREDIIEIEDNASVIDTYNSDESNLGEFF